MKIYGFRPKIHGGVRYTRAILFCLQKIRKKKITYNENTHNKIKRGKKTESDELLTI